MSRCRLAQIKRGANAAASPARTPRIIGLSSQEQWDQHRPKQAQGRGGLPYSLILPEFELPPDRVIDDPLHGP
jgi:hypothetical protein